MKQILLSGGGNAEQSKRLDEILVSLISENKKILYIPIAWSSGVYDSCSKWFLSTFSLFGTERIEMWTKLSKKEYNDLEQFGAIYIGGGNTFSLMNDLRKSGFIGLLKKFIESGRVVYGGSAGAIIFGKDIRTAFYGNDSDENLVNLADFSGLNLVNDFSIQCHYKNNQDKEIFDFIKETKLNVIALHEDTGLWVLNDKIKVIGYNPAYIFRNGKKNEVKVDSFVK